MHARTLPREPYLLHIAAGERGTQEARPDPPQIVGESIALRETLRLVHAVAPTDTTVLISGETGTGKELVARAIHRASSRRDRSFVRINCAAIPLGLLESELFGHERGAFTGALARRIGKFEAADRGTLFLDEIGDMPLELQSKLLRVLQEREFERVGSSMTQRADVRVIAATHVDLPRMVRERRFREDLFYRLSVFPIAIPPLRERRSDVSRLVLHFVAEHARRLGKPVPHVPAGVLDVLAEHAWPGNVRELQNFVERSMVLTVGPTLRVPAEMLPKPGPPPPLPEAERDEAAPVTLEDAERRHIHAALEKTNWVVAGPRGAAVLLGMKRSTLAFRMQKLGLVRARSPKGKA